MNKNKIIIIIVSEMFLGANYGLGKLIYNSSIIFDTATVIAGIICIGTIGYLLNKLILKIENKTVHWKGY